MADFFHLVPQIHYGRGVAARSGEALRRLGVRHALVVCDPGVLAAGVADPVVRSIERAGVACSLFTDIQTNPSEAVVHAAARRFAEAGCDGIVGLGGGSAMDVAKCAATVHAGGGSIADYEDGARAAPAEHPPLMLVPTTAGTGSEAVAGAIITDSRRVFKMHIVAVPASVALCDPELTATLPAEPTAASGIDALAHAIGAYVSRERQPLADGMALYAISTIARALPAAVADAADLTAREAMMVGSLSAGISMKGGGAVDHAFAHAVNAVFDLHHGVGVALFLADGMEFNLPHLPDRFADIARALGAAAPGDDPRRAAAAGVDGVRRLVAGLPLPGLRQVGVDERDVPGLADKVMADRFHLGLNPVPLERADAVQILLAAVRRDR